MSNPANFAPYQPPPPEHPRSPASISPAPGPTRAGSGPQGYQHSSPSRGPAFSGGFGGGSSPSSSSAAYAPVGSAPGVGDGSERVNKYETSLGARVDVEAAGAYALGVV